MNSFILRVTLGAVSLAAVSLSAQSRDVVAGLATQANSSQTMPVSELVMPTKLADLPDVPQVPRVYPVGSAHPSGMGPGPLLPQSFHDKLMAYAVTVAGPRALLTPAFPAAIRMANPPNRYPPEWRQGAQAFGRNYGDQFAAISTYETVRFAVGAALHEDLRYQPSTSTNFFKRTGHALLFNFVDRSDDGHARLAVANFAGLAAGSYVGMSYLPTGFNDVTHADQRLAIRFGTLAGSNIGAEFAPDIFRFLAEHHLPIPKIPIPEWWVKR